MTYWMISANENKYNHVSAFNKWGSIDWKTYANYTPGDIVYIYCSRTKRKVMFKTVVEKTGIPFDERIDDASLWNERDEVDPSMKYTRLRLIRTIDRNELSLENIKKIGIKNGPQRPMKLSLETVNYFEKFFSIGMDEEGIISFPCGETYGLVRETNIHAHPIDHKPRIEKVPRYLMVRATGGISDDLFVIERTIEFNPLDIEELDKYKSEWFYNNLKLYISKRKNSVFGFKSAPIPYRYYILNKVYSFDPAFKVNHNGPNYRFLTFEDIGVELIKHTELKKPIIKVSADEIEASEGEEQSIKKAIESLLVDESKSVTGYEYVAKPEDRKEVKESSDSMRPSLYPRDPQKRINALNRAGFVCEINPDHKSFISKRTNKPYMETHHLIPLEYWRSFDNNLDVEANIVCLCSNCHNEIHYGKYADKLIRPLFMKREYELQEAGISIDLDDLLKMYNGEEIEY